MPSAQLSVLRFESDTPSTEPPAAWQEPPGEAPNLNHLIETGLRAKRVELALEHRDLDCTIMALAEANACDELLLSRLKKRRLHLKDELARIDGYLPA